MTETPEQPIRILLVDDHAVVRKGMRALLDREPGLEVVAAAGAGHERPGDRRRVGGRRGDGTQPRQQHPEKLQLASRTQAALYALREGLATLDEGGPAG
jgi:DNA-binding NarL/FixJ family response regulator